MGRGRLNIVNKRFTKLGGISKMKKLTKTLLFAFASLFLTSSLFAATLHEGKAAQSSFVLAQNHQYGNNYEAQGSTGNILPKDYVAKKGDKITIHLEGTVNQELVLGKDGDQPKSLDLLFVDGTSAANWWLELTERTRFDKAIKPGDKIVWDVTFEIKTNGFSKAGDGGCRFVLSSAPEQAKEVTLKTTKFTYKIER